MEKNIKKHGFLHEKLIVIPDQIIDNMINHPLISTLYLTDIGYYPKAKSHYRERPNGCANYILIFCVNGSGIIKINHQEINIEKNQLYIIEANVTHMYHALVHHPWSIYWLHFNGSKAESFASLINTRQSPVYIMPDKHSQLIKQFNNMYTHLEMGYSIDNVIHISSLLGVFLSSINHSSTFNNLPKKNSTNSINKCIEYMVGHVDEQINLNQLAHALNLSKSYLIHLFKENTGFSPIDYFIHLKLQKACKLLDTTELSIKEIANSLDYNDPYYFSRIFKKIMECSPTHYRKIKKG